MTDDEQLEVYRAVIDVIKSRLDKAASLTRTTTSRGRPERASSPTTR